MTHQALSLEDLQPCYSPHRTFIARCGPLGTWVLPAEVLDDTPLSDPETGLQQPSLRQRCSMDGQLCYAQVLYAMADGLYWANVSATPDVAHPEHIMLTEAHLVYALAWDERLTWRTPAQIRRLMQAQAEDLVPLPHPEPKPPAAPFPTPPEPLTIVTTVEVTPEELREAFASNEAVHTPEVLTRLGPRAPRVCHVQQGLLRALSRALHELLEGATDQYTAHVLQALTVLVKRVRRWQQQTHQRVVNAVRTWDDESRGLAWALTLGVPQALLGAA